MRCVSFLELSELSDLEQSRAGGKGRSLAVLTKHGFSVPPGFVVLDEAFREMLSRSGIAERIEKVLTSAFELDLQAAASELQALVLNAPFPEILERELEAAFDTLDASFVAVRSSASVEDGQSLAWAGLFESYLNCSRNEFLSALRKCWASLYSPRTLSYAREHAVDFSEVSMAVVVQSMVASEVAGTAFSRHPVTKDGDQVVLEAAFGLGEAVVSGAVTPDQFIFSKSTSALVDTKIAMKERMLFRGDDGQNEWRYLMRTEGKKQTLSQQEACELATLVSKIEKSYGHPVDVEWARERGRWYILQSRPVTA